MTKVPVYRQKYVDTPLSGLAITVIPVKTNLSATQYNDIPENSVLPN